MAGGRVVAMAVRDAAFAWRVSEVLDTCLG